MQIGIIDSNIKWIEKSSHLLRKYAAQIGLDLDIVSCCQNIEQFILKYEGIPLDVVFINVELGGGRKQKWH